MRRRASYGRHAAALLCAVTLGVVSIGAQGRGGGAPVGIVQQTRNALAHGDVAGATQNIALAPGNVAARNLASALVDLFEGKDADARALLTPMANAAPLGEASLELGLLDLRTGHRTEAISRLDPLTRVNTASIGTPDDWFRFARAARGIGEFKLAFDVYDQKLADLPRADMQGEFGDMLLQRHKPGDAVAAYKRALTADGKWVPAMIGLARALSDDNPKDASKAIAAALAQAPDYPDLWLAIAQDKVGNDDLAAAADALDHLAKVKPGTIEEAAFRVLPQYERDGLAGVESAMPAVFAVRPGTSLGYRYASEWAAHKYRFDDSAALAKKATELDKEDGAAFLDLGLALMRTGDEAAARTALESAWDLDKSVAVNLNLLNLLDSLATFDIVSHNDFIFKFAKEESAVMKVYALPLADEAYRQYVQRYGFTPKGPILVEVFPKHDDFAVRTVGLMGMTGALGACFGRVVTMDSPHARIPLDFSWQATLWHELAHVFTLQLSDYRVPRWLTEGISVYEEHRRQPAWGREMSLEFARRLVKGENFGVKKLPNAFKNPETLSAAYFEAALLVEHLVELKGESGLRTLLLAYANGAKDDDAFAKAFGLSIDDVEKSFATFVDKQFGSLRVAMQDPPRKVDEDDIVALRARAAEAPGNYISQMALASALVRLKDLNGAKAPLERAAALAPEAQGDDSPRAMLADIVAPTDPARARQLLRELLTYDHTNVNEARKLASLAAAAKATDEEDFALRLVADLDPFDADTHSKLGGRLLVKRDYAAALTEFQATLALGPTNAAEAHTDAADALLHLGRRDDAKREALLALKDAPTFARAQDLLLAAQ